LRKKVIIRPYSMAFISTIFIQYNPAGIYIYSPFPIPEYTKSQLKRRDFKEEKNLKWDHRRPD
jgi:hypothetical protein